MTEEWKIQQDRKNPKYYNIVSNTSNWFIAEQITYNHAMTIVTHFNNYGAVKLDKNGAVNK
jgi:hypothetical protein